MSMSICDLSDNSMTPPFTRVPLSDTRYLPDHIVALILKRIPFSSIVQYRAVCKQWNSMIMSVEFSGEFEKPVSTKCLPMLVGNDHNKGWSIRVLNSKSDSWASVSLPFLQNRPQSGPFYLTASSGGLMCFETGDGQSFIVCNPITKNWRHLRFPFATNDVASRSCSCVDPTFCIHPTNDLPNTVTGLTVDQQAGGYKLIVASLAESRNRRTFIYDSLEGSWTVGAQMPCAEGFVNLSSLTVKGSLYCLIGDRSYLCPQMVAKYDPKRDSWCRSALLSRFVLPNFHRKNELELLEHGGGVKILARPVQRMVAYRPFSDQSNTLYGSAVDMSVEILSVLESSGGIEVVGSHWNGRPDLSHLQLKSRLERARNYSAGGHGKTKAAAYSASCVGQGDDIFILGRWLDLERKIEKFQVLKVNSTSTTSLSSWNADFQDNTNMEIRLFEPSLTARV